jgi:hypothetical protein
MLLTAEMCPGEMAYLHLLAVLQLAIHLDLSSVQLQD